MRALEEEHGKRPKSEIEHKTSALAYFVTNVLPFQGTLYWDSPAGGRKMAESKKLFANEQHHRNAKNEVQLP